MPKCRITVLERALNRPLAQRYCAHPPEQPCEIFSEGQQFLLDRAEPPAGFCEDGWNAIRAYVFGFISGGRGFYEGWMKDPDTMVACCNDAIQPVTFLLERVEE